jgi:hypothetical protein
MRCMAAVLTLFSWTSAHAGKTADYDALDVHAFHSQFDLDNLMPADCGL